MSFEAIERRFSISERTLLRYVAACKKKLLDPAGRPLVEVVQRGSRRYLSLAQSNATPGSTAYEAVSLYFVLTLLKFLEGMVIQEGVEDIWERVRRDLPGSQRLTLADFDRKFYSVDYAPKHYAEHEEVVDLLLRALIYQWRLLIDYGGLAGEGKTHRFDPYTLVGHKGGLYLIGLSDVYKKIIYLAVERIRKATRLLDANGNTQRFTYPGAYRPERQMDGAFGIFEGPETKVELLLLGDTEALLRAREIHPTQRFHRRPDGKTVLMMTVRSTPELINWILSLGPWVEVLKPKELRQEIASLLASAGRLYSDMAPDMGRME
jgi:proteasome accessory factor B